MSFLFDLDEKSEAAAAFITKVRDELVRAFVMQKSESGATLQSVAEKIGGDRSAVHRLLNGEGNLTLRKVAELSWAFGKEPFFEIRSHEVSSADIRSDYSIVRPKMAKIDQSCSQVNCPPATRSEAIGSFSMSSAMAS